MVPKCAFSDDDPLWRSPLHQVGGSSCDEDTWLTPLINQVKEIDSGLGNLNFKIERAAKGFPRVSFSIRGGSPRSPGG